MNISPKFNADGKKNYQPKIAILISGDGSNLQSMIDSMPVANFNISLVVSNKANAYGIQRAKKASIKTAIIENKNFATRAEFDQAIDDVLAQNSIEFIILAGFMRILTKEFTNKWLGKIINIHPSLLPCFKGADAVLDALNQGVKFSGCTVHHVTPEVDSGAIILQSVVRIYPTDTKASLQTRIKKAEHICLPLASYCVLNNITNNITGGNLTKHDKSIIHHIMPENLQDEYGNEILINYKYPADFP